MRQYTREDVDYGEWYSPWSKRLASSLTLTQIERELGMASTAAASGARSHLRAIDATGSMSGQSQRRAHARNVTSAAGEYRIALSGALEIHELFPENAYENA